MGMYQSLKYASKEILSLPGTQLANSNRYANVCGTEVAYCNIHADEGFKPCKNHAKTVGLPSSPKKITQFRPHSAYLAHAKLISHALTGVYTDPGAGCGLLCKILLDKQVKLWHTSIIRCHSNGLQAVLAL